MRIGLFGGAGCGKSEVNRILKTEYDALIIEADKVAHGLYAKFEAGYKEVIRLCGNGILDEAGNIDRKKLGALLYAETNLRDAVNHAVHPLVYKKCLEIISDVSNPLIVYEAALITPDCELPLDHKIYVHAPEAQRRERLKASRHYTDARIDEIILAQPTEDEYRKYCDIILENNGNLKELEDKTYAVIEYCQRQQR